MELVSYIGIWCSDIIYNEIFSSVDCIRKKKKSYVPVIFWYFNLSGGLLLLVYSIHRKDPVFILGQSTGVFIYARNLYFIHKKKD